MLKINELPISKSSLKTLADETINSLLEQGGFIYATERLSAMSEYIDGIRQDKRFVEGVRSEVELYGKMLITNNSSKVELAETGTKYDYSNCNDAEYFSLLADLEKAKEMVKVRESFLKGVPSKGFEVTDTTTGEIVTIYPPVKTSTSSFKVTLNK
jgi:hypothetical protein